MNFEKLEKFRVTSGFMPTKEGDYHGLFFVKTKNNVTLKVISSGKTDKEWYHVSISLPNRCPTWSEMALIKELFYGEDALVLQFHPKKEDYVNNHPYCLHLWEYLVGVVPTPPSIYVGI